MDTNSRQIFRSTSRRIVANALVLGLVLSTGLFLGAVGAASPGLAALVSVHPAEAAEAINFRYVASSYYEFSRDGNGQACLNAAQRTLEYNRVTVWDFAHDGDQWVQAKSPTAMVQVICYQAAETWTRVFVSVYGNDLDTTRPLLEHVTEGILAKG